MSPNKKLNPAHLRLLKETGQKLSMITCYDYSFACIINQTDIDLILVGDSGVMVSLGYPDTTHATVEMMTMMTKAVSKGATDKCIIADMPFLSQRQGVEYATASADILIKSGANAIKIEGVNGHEKVIQHLTESGIPVMGHLGLTPQSVHSTGYRLQGKTDQASKTIKEQAIKLEKLGCFGVVLECIPSELAAEIQMLLSIPIIGIGAGKYVDGQVLVLQDMLGITEDLKPKFVRHFLNGKALVQSAIDNYCHHVQNGDYPNKTESYHKPKSGNVGLNNTTKTTATTD